MVCLANVSSNSFVLRGVYLKDRINQGEKKTLGERKYKENQTEKYVS